MTLFIFAILYDPPVYYSYIMNGNLYASIILSYLVNVYKLLNEQEFMSVYLSVSR